MDNIDITGPHKTFDNMAEYYILTVVNDTLEKMFNKQKQYIEWFIADQGYTAENINQIINNTENILSFTLKIYHYETLVAFKLKFT